MTTATEDRKAEELAEVLAYQAQQTQAARLKMPVVLLLLPWKTVPADTRFFDGETNILNRFGSVTATVRDAEEARAIVERMNELGRSES